MLCFLFVDFNGGQDEAPEFIKPPVEVSRPQ